jgi:hypothetical protein
MPKRRSKQTITNDYIMGRYFLFTIPYGIIYLAGAFAGQYGLL